MEDNKQRNRDHIRNKRKYKPKSVKDPKYIPHKSTLNLESNWDRYENESDNQDFQLTSNTDFSMLASAPITKGHHFQFKSDKLIAEEIEDKVQADLFNLNLNVLRDSILTIPFHDRVGIDTEYFTENQLKYMVRDADINLTKFNEKYSKKTVEEETKKILQSKSVDSNKDGTIVDDNILANKEENQSSVPSDLFEDLLEADDIADVKQLQDKPDEDLEQWLDAILDE